MKVVNLFEDFKDEIRAGRADCLVTFQNLKSLGIKREAFKEDVEGQGFLIKEVSSIENKYGNSDGFLIQGGRV